MVKVAEEGGRDHGAGDLRRELGDDPAPRRISSLRPTGERQLSCRSVTARPKGGSPGSAAEAAATTRSGSR